MLLLLLPRPLRAQHAAKAIQSAENITFDATGLASHTLCSQKGAASLPARLICCCGLPCCRANAGCSAPGKTMVSSKQNHWPTLDGQRSQAAKVGSAMERWFAPLQGRTMKKIPTNERKLTRRRCYTQLSSSYAANGLQERGEGFPCAGTSTGAKGNTHTTGLQKGCQGKEG